MNTNTSAATAVVRVIESRPEESIEPIVSLVSALATVLASATWPIAIFAIAFLLRKEVRELINRIRTIKHGDTEVDLNAQFDASLPEAPPAQLGDDRLTMEASVTELSARQPIDAIVTAWVGVERSIESLVGRVGSTGSGRYSTSTAVRHLSSIGVLFPSIAQQIRELQRLRNIAVHHPEQQLGESEVLRYVSTAAEVVHALDQLPVVSPDPHP